MSVTATGSGRTATGEYEAESRKEPSSWNYFTLDSVIPQLISACVDAVARQFRDDPKIAQALGG